MIILNKFHRLCITLVLLSGSVVVAQGADDVTLFEYSIPNKALYKQTADEPPATHKIRINQGVAASNVGGLLVFPLPDGTQLNISVTQRTLARNGDLQITGEFGTDGVATITFGKSVTFANISSAEHSYAISVDEERESLLIDYQKADLQITLGDDMVIPEDFKQMTAAEEQLSRSKRIAKAGAKIEITFLALYSPEFANAFVDPETRINQMITFSNAAYDRSGINIELQLAHAKQIGFVNSEGTGSLLTKVRSASGPFVDVPKLRNDYYADLVAVLPYSFGNSISGIASVGGNNSSQAYSVSQFARFGSDALFAHEIGHNLGSGHEWANARFPCNGGYTDYSCGHGNGTHGTIMSYQNRSVWGYRFSNLSNDCDMQACGIAAGMPNPADNQTSFNITAPFITDYRIDTSNDDDKDGIKNDVDNCPSVRNSSQANLDGDMQGDACDDDDDNDGVNDVADNCPREPNSNQADGDRNGVGDACQNDSLCFPIAAKNNGMSQVCL